jgi:hypothetical protein
MPPRLGGDQLEVEDVGEQAIHVAQRRDGFSGAIESMTAGMPP